METRTEPLTEQVDEPGTDAASLSGIGLWRSAAGMARKDGDITAMLAAMPASPEVLSNYDDIEVPPEATMRDVTPRWYDIVDWWNSLRQSDSMPPRDRLKVSDIVAQWPNLVLFRCGAIPGQLQPDTAFAAALRGHRGGQDQSLPGGAEATAVLSQCLLRLANKAFAAKEPVPDETRIDTAKGPIAYRLVALPFGLEHRPDHILCQVEAH